MQMSLFRFQLMTVVGIACIGIAHSAPTVDGTTISWPDDGWYQVQNANTYESICGGGRSCEVAPGLYNVINHGTGERFENILVEASSAGPAVDGNTISWADDGWYQVQDATSYMSICEGGVSCEVSAGTYHVINLTTGQRFESIEVTGTNGNAGGGNNGGDSVYPATIDIVEANSYVGVLPGWTFNDEEVDGKYIADVDGDGQRDFVFMTVSANESACETQVVVLSSLADSINLTTEDLQDTLQITNSLFAERDYDGNGCYNIDTVANALDINGDGLEDLSVFTRLEDYPDYGQTQYQISAVVFGTRIGDVLDLATLDGQNGFVITDADIPISGVGDVNGDGYADYGFVSGGFFQLSQTRLMAGAASLPARREGRDILNSAALTEFEGGTTLRPLGDINADGLDDFYTSRFPFTARVVLGSRDDSLKTDLPGFSTVYAMGDHDGDGYDDFLVSQLTNGCGFHGQISSIIYGSDDTSYLETPLDISIFDSERQTRLLASSDNTCGMLGARGLGDVNGDGVNDVLAGRTNILFGTPGRRDRIVAATDLDGTNGFRLTGTTYGTSVDGIDIDADGYTDLIIDGQAVIVGMPTVSLDTLGPQNIVVQVREDEWTVHWQSPVNAASAYSLALNGYELTSVANMNSATVSDALLAGGGLLVVSALNDAGSVVGSNTRQIPAYEEYEALAANVYGPKSIELMFNSETFFASALYHLVWRNNELLDRSSPAGAEGYYDTSVQPGQIYRYFVQPDYLLNERLEVSYLTRWPLIQRQSRVVEAWTPLEGVSIPAAGSGVLITGGNILYWPDDGTYQVVNGSTGDIICEGGLACEVPNGTYDVVNLTTGERYPGVFVSEAGGGETPDGIAPSGPANVSLQIYAARVAELFWDRAPASERVVETQVYRDGELLGTSAGNSYYDGSREIDVAHWYELVAVDADGDRSTASTLNYQRAVQTLMPPIDANSGSFGFRNETVFEGNVVAIGAPGNNSFISVFERSEDSENWVLVQQLEPDPSDAFEAYGSYIELDGNTLVVVGSDLNQNSFDANVLYIYTRDSELGWRETQKISNAVNADDSVAIDGDSMAVRRVDGVEMFTRDSATGQWGSVQFITIESAIFFPDRAMVLRQGRLAVGVAGHIQGGASTGAAYVYRQMSTGAWELEQQLVPDFATHGLQAGRTIGFDGNTLVLTTGDGRIVVFSLMASGSWIQSTALDPIAPDYISLALAVDADRLLVGVPQVDGLTRSSGFAAVFRNTDAEGWIETTRLVPSMGSDEFFGFSVSISGSEVLVGASTSLIDFGLSSNENIGYLFEID